MSPSSDQDADALDLSLVERTRNGDRRAFGDLVERYQKPVYNIALRIVHDPVDAEDVAQTVFMKAYERLDTFDPNRRFFSWLYRIAMNEAINHAKRGRSHERLDTTLQDPGPSPETRLSRAEVKDRVDEAVLRLKPEDRALVCLSHFQSFSYAEIAFILDITESKVKSRLYTARQRLRKILLRQGGGQK